MMNQMRRISFRLHNVRMKSVYEHSDWVNISRNKRKESFNQKKARLLYQSRKRGMLENGLLLSTFANEHLDRLTPQLMDQYDKLINEPSNEWDIFYWITGKEKVPADYDNKILNMLKIHTKNKDCRQRYTQPNLKIPTQN